MLNISIMTKSFEIFLFYFTDIKIQELIEYLRGHVKM